MYRRANRSHLSRTGGRTAADRAQVLRLQAESRCKFAYSNLRWGIETRPRQSDVYVPRRLSHVNGSVTGASSHGACEADQLGSADQVSGREHGRKPGVVFLLAPAGQVPQARCLRLPDAVLDRACWHCRVPARRSGPAVTSRPVSREECGDAAPVHVGEGALGPQTGGIPCAGSPCALPVTPVH